jgi:predicted CoA-binding protein
MPRRAVAQVSNAEEQMTESSIPALLRRPDTTIAVVGATDTPGKYGGIVYRDLKAKGHRVLPVNPGRATVDGDPAYPTVADLPEGPTIVNIAVPPAAALDVLAACLEAGHTNVWLQPGAESPAVEAFLDANGFHYLANACIMVQTRAG